MCKSTGEEAANAPRRHAMIESIEWWSRVKHFIPNTSTIEKNDVRLVRCSQKVTELLSYHHKLRSEKVSVYGVKLVIQSIINLLIIFNLK